MREFKFRAWDNIMVYGCWAVGVDDIGPYYHEDGVGEYYYCEAVMQYTGLKDKNGVEIYEGDIVHIVKDKFRPGSDEVWTVRYSNSTARFEAYNQLNSFRDFDFDFENYTGAPIVHVCTGYEFIPEVIGNIYENPELLGEDIC